MAKKQMSRDDVVKLMRKVQGDRTQRDFAVELGISQQYLCDIYKGAKDPGDTVLTALGLVRHVIYERAS